MSFNQGIALKTYRTESSAKEIAIVFAASLFIAICSQVAVPLFFTPVPMTLQTFAIATMGWMLGAKRGAFAVLAYLLEGVMGLPVFPGLSSGVVMLIGPTGGYLLGFIIAAMLSGAITHKTSNIGRLALGFGLCSIVIHLCGLPWLSLWTGIGQAFQLGLFPFIIGDLVKICLSITTVKLWLANKEKFNFPSVV
ncbi:MAG: biotin transporter BioY [Parachlamydiaceae bacterium]